VIRCNKNAHAIPLGTYRWRHSRTRSASLLGTLSWGFSRSDCVILECWRYLYGTMGGACVC